MIYSIYVIIWKRVTKKLWQNSVTDGQALDQKSKPVSAMLEAGNIKKIWDIFQEPKFVKVQIIGTS